ncbi:MAG: tryptophan--tRNA ligase [bacterium]
MSKPIIVSGIKPSGDLHIGNYLGSIKQFIDWQNKADCYFFIADYHSLTENYDPKLKAKQTLEVAGMYLAAGLDPNKCVLFVQSDVPSHTELSWIFNCVTPVSFLERMTQYKDKTKKDPTNRNMGLFDYPVLQAADILMYKAIAVPVGQDQVQHVELTRDIAKLFNKRFGQTFPEPKAIITEVAKVMSLLDPNKKMSKSYGQGYVINLLDDEKTVIKKLSKAVTDTATSGKMSAGVANLFLLLKHFGEQKTYDSLIKEYTNGTIKYSVLKQELAGSINRFLKPLQERYQRYAKDPKALRKVLDQGKEKAGAVARETMMEVREKIGLLN